MKLTIQTHPVTTIGMEPAGIMIVKDNDLVMKIGDSFPGWTVLSATKFTAKTEADYIELLRAEKRVVFWRPADFIKDRASKRAQVIMRIAESIQDTIEVYGWQDDTVPQMITYCHSLFPLALNPVLNDLDDHIVYEPRFIRRLRRVEQIKMLAYSTNEKNIELIKNTING